MPPSVDPNRTLHGEDKRSQRGGPCASRLRDDSRQRTRRQRRRSRRRYHGSAFKAAAAGMTVLLCHSLLLSFGSGGSCSQPRQQRQRHHAHGSVGPAALALACWVPPTTTNGRRRRFDTISRLMDQPGAAPSPPFAAAPLPRRLLSTRLKMSSGRPAATGGGGEPNFDSADPYQVLGLGGAPTADLQLIKRAYKRLALRHHPDVSTDADKKRASDRFAKINWAYQTLSGRLRDPAAAEKAEAASRSSAARPGGGGGWTPPHRRATSTAGTAGSGSGAGFGAGRTPGSNGGPSTDWRDYMPRYEEEDAMYDAGGDSLGAIFRDLVAGAAGGGRGVLKDFVEFLEQNLDGYGASSAAAAAGGDDDAGLKDLLRTGTLADIGDEMDTTELVVNQLTEKLRQLDQEAVLLTAEAKIAARYMDKLQLEERLEEIKARRKVAEGYIGKARKRLLSLQSRYKEMVMAGDNDSKAGGRTGGSAAPSSWTDIRAEAAAPATYRTTAASAPAGSASATQRPRHDKPEDSWKDDSFGSFGRGRGSSRRHRAPQPQTAASPSTTAAARSSYSTGPSPSSARPSSPATSSGPYRSATSSATTKAPSAIPPQRVGPYSYEEDKRRLRDLKVDEEFDKLKKELGL